VDPAEDFNLLSPAFRRLPYILCENTHGSSRLLYNETIKK
jgi:hypothetical protein